MSFLAAIRIGPGPEVLSSLNEPPSTTSSTLSQSTMAGTLQQITTTVTNASFTTSSSLSTSQISVSSPSSSFSATQESSSSSPTSGTTPGVATVTSTVLVQEKLKSELPMPHHRGCFRCSYIHLHRFVGVVSSTKTTRRRSTSGNWQEFPISPVSEMANHTHFLFIIDSGRSRISPYEFSRPPQHGKLFVGARAGMTGMAATKVTTFNFATRIVRHTSQQAPAAATTSFTLGNPNNLVSTSERGTLPMPGDPENDPPPSYWESFSPR